MSKDEVDLYNLALLSYGSETELKRALFSIYTFIGHVGPALYQYRLCLYTDQPSWFAQRLPLSASQLVLKELDSEKLRALRGPADFYLRPKICMMLELLQEFPAPTLFVDSDTFFLKDPSGLFQKITPQTSLLHQAEYPFSTLQELDEKHQRLWDFFEGIQFSIKGDLVPLNPEWLNWNSGTIGLHQDHIPLVSKVLNLTDEIYPPTRHPTCEQYAYSIILQTHTKVLPADASIYHYWYHVKKRIMAEFIEQFLSEERLSLPLVARGEAARTATLDLSKRIQRAPVLQIDRALRWLDENRFQDGFILALKTILTGKIRDFVYYRQLGSEALRFLRQLFTGKAQKRRRRGFVAD